MPLVDGASILSVCSERCSTIDKYSAVVWPSNSQHLKTCISLHIRDCKFVRIYLEFWLKKPTEYICKPLQIQSTCCNPVVWVLSLDQEDS